MQLREYQKLALYDAIDTLKANKSKLYAAPTGTGKSLIELALLDAFDDAWLITPRLEIIAGMLDKLGVTADTEGQLIREAEKRRIVTPIRLYNQLMAGERLPPGKLILDEAHHDLAQSWQGIHALCGQCPKVGFTATPYRGTPKGTAAFREMWGEPEWIISYPEAVEAGYLAFPSIEVWPLVDDDVIECSNGEFVIRSIERETDNKLQDVVNLCGRFYANAWDRPTMFAVPSSSLAYALQQAFNDAHIATDVVTQETTHVARRVAFDDCIACRSALIQIQVVGEGVDLPIRRLVDLAPSISPVKWLQQVGRITRPTDMRPEYICTNRNLLRHSYLLGGLIPPATYRIAQDDFAGIGKRSGVRVIGLEALGRLQATEVPTLSGITATLYAVSAIEGSTKVEYAALLHPLRSEPLWCVKESVSDGEGGRTWGKWRLCTPPTDLRGYASIPGSSPSEKQLVWWKRSAARYGLDPGVTPTRKSFVALPILADVGGRIL